MNPPLILLPGQAEHLYWMGRYLERALCRSVLILDMQAAFGPALPLWNALPAVFADEKAFRAAKGVSVPEFYLQQGVHGVPGMIAQARDNARIVRPILLEVLWEQLNTLLAQTGAAESAASSAAVYAIARNGLLTLSGMADRLLRRDESWLFFRLGQLLERAEQTICLCNLVPPAKSSAQAAWTRQLPRLLGGTPGAERDALLTSRDLPAAPVFNLMRAEILLRRIPCLALAEECRQGAAAAIDAPAAWLTAQQNRLDHLHGGILEMLKQFS